MSSAKRPRNSPYQALISYINNASANKIWLIQLHIQIAINNIKCKEKSRFYRQETQLMKEAEFMNKEFV
jgi:hypothetical protein